VQSGSLGTELRGQVKTIAASEVFEQYSLGRKPEPEESNENADETEGENPTGPSVAELVMQRATELDDHLYSFARKDIDAASSSKSMQDLLTDQSLVSTNWNPPCHLRNLLQGVLQTRPND